MTSRSVRRRWRGAGARRRAPRCGRAGRARAGRGGAAADRGDGARSSSPTARCPASPSPWSTTTRWSTSAASGCARSASPRPSTPTPCSSSPRCRSRSRRPSSRSWSARASSTGTAASPTSTRRFALHDPYPTAEVTLRDLFNHRSGLPGTSRRRPRGDRLRPRRRSASGCGWCRRRRASAPATPTANAGLTQGRAGGGDGRPARPGRRSPRSGSTGRSAWPRPAPATPTSSRARQPRRRCTCPRTARWAALVERDPDAQAPAGGVSSTVRDLASGCGSSSRNGGWQRRAVHRADAIAATHEPLIARGANPVSGGASLLRPRLERRSSAATGCPGATPARSATARAPLVTLYPDAGLGIVVLANAFPTGVPEGIADSFFDLVFDGSVSRDWVAAWDARLRRPVRPGDRGGEGRPTPPRRSRRPRRCPPAPMSARYANAYVGEAMVAADGGALTVRGSGRTA